MYVAITSPYLRDWGVTERRVAREREAKRRRGGEGGRTERGG